MAITTDSYYDIVYDEETLDRIGLSKTLDNYSISEIADYAYVGSYSYYGKQMMSKSLSGYTYVGFSQINGSCPFAANFHSGTYETIDIEDGQTENYNLTENGLYRRVILLNAVNGQYADIINDISNYKIITEFDAPKYTIDLGNKSSMLFESTPYWYYDNIGGITRYNTHLGANDNVQIATCGFAAYVIIPFNSTYYILRAALFSQIFDAYSINNSYVSHCSDVFTDYSGNNPAAIAETVTEWFKNYDFTDADSTPIVHPLNISIDYWAPYDGYCSLLRFSGAAMGFFQHFMFTDESKLMTFLAGMYGLHFIVDGTVYKPIITDNFVVGYSDDLNVTSDLDNYVGSTKHDLPVTPPTPPTPPPGPGYDDDPWSGATFAGVGVGGAGAFAKCYYMTSTELANLRSWMNSINVPEGFDPMQQIIGLSQVPVALSGDGAENVVFVNSSAVYDPGVTTRAVDTGVATQQAMGSPISYYLGSVDIARRMQERGEPYLDYDCQIELYLPLIGMFSLDTQAVMGRTISAYAVLDPVSGTLAAYAYVTKDGQNLPVAYGSTSIGVDLPISAQQLSVSRAALKQANAQLGASLLSGALTMLAAASSGGKSSGSGAKTSTGSSGLSAAGIREAGSDYMKASQVGNVFGDFMQWGRTIRQLSYGNNTAVAGSFGGSTAQWSYPFTPYVKIIRPRYEKPSNYAHSQGVPCVQTKTVGSCTGFIQCIGVDVSGITGATDLELQAIQAALSNGIYAGGGS